MFDEKFSENQINFLTDFFYLYGKFKSWSDLVKEYNLNHELFFKWCHSKMIPKYLFENTSQNHRKKQLQMIKAIIVTLLS